MPTDLDGNLGNFIDQLLQRLFITKIFLKLNQNGFLSECATTQLYCREHQSFLADRFVESYCDYPDAQGDQCELCGRLLDPLDLKSPRCKLDNTTPVSRMIILFKYLKKGS